MKRSSQNWLVVCVVVGAAVVLAVPLAAQENSGNQPIMNQAQGSSIDIGMLQRTGPGGDLEHTAQSAGMHATVSCTNFCSECHWLDSYNAVNTYVDGVAGSQVINTLSTTNILASGKLYLITITGNMTYWGNSYWTAPIGSPEDHPMFASPAVALNIQGYVGADWEYLYGYPNNNKGNLFVNGPGHLGSNYISLDNGLTYQDLIPLNGMVYNGNHVYTFLVWGKGQKAKFQDSDQGPHNDNYGRFWICVQLLTPCGDVTPPAQ